MMRTNTKKFKLIQFIGSHKGLRYSELERFICEMNGYDYDTMSTSYKRSYVKELNNFGTSLRVVNKPINVRRHKGIWATNLTSGKDCILKKYCVKNENKRWILNAETQKFVESMSAPVKSSLESVTGDDAIKGNSVPVSVNHVRIPISQERKFEALTPYDNPMPAPVSKPFNVIDAVTELRQLQETHGSLAASMRMIQEHLAKNYRDQEALKNTIRHNLEM